ncbi:MAG: response regulator [Alphaproteobacteria bacterium]|nr:response regulator [Alphaproteobacteria bacterium]
MHIANLHPIMIVEDSDDDYEATERALKKDGRLANPVIRFENGEDAVRYLLNEGPYADSRQFLQPIIILLDLNLPGGGGLHALSRIKAVPKLSTIPIVVLTSSGDRRDVEKCYEAGANTYVQKPVELDSLFTAVQQLKDYWLGLALLPGENA